VQRSRVAVAIVNANSGPLLAQALSALANQAARPDLTVVVDNASTDGSTDDLEARFPGVTVVRLDENVGFAAANNLAAREAADCEWLALLNPDAFPEPRWLEELLAAAAQKPEYTFFASRLVMDADPDRLDAAGDVFHVSGVAWPRDRGVATSAAPAAGEVFSPSAAAALYRRDAFLEAGGFDERFFCYFEDVDLGFRLRLAGHRCWYVPTAVVRHVGQSTSGRDSDFFLYHTHRNIVWTYAKDMPSPLVWLYLPQHVLFNLLVLIPYARLRRFRLVLRAKVDAIRGLPAVLRERRLVQRRRVASSRALRAVMSKGLDVVPLLSRRSRELRGASGAPGDARRGP
jgi:GT2 family glycosyltransferase